MSDRSRQTSWVVGFLTGLATLSRTERETHTEGGRRRRRHDKIKPNEAASVPRSEIPCRSYSGGRVEVLKEGDGGDEGDEGGHHMS